MAVCQIKSIHCWKGKTVKQTLSEIINYALNEKKTSYIDKNNKKKTLAETYECGENIADEWFLLKSLYAKLTGRSQGSKDVLAYHIIQSFDPKEKISHELANKIGCEMAKELTGGEFSFVVGTHLDKSHLHNHIVINSTALDATHKYRDVKRSFEKVLKNLNDDICKKYSLSIVEEEKNENKTKYIHWLNRNFDKRIEQDDKATWQNILCQIIDIILGRDSNFNVLSEDEKKYTYENIKKELEIERSDFRPKDFNEFLEMLKKCGYEVKGLDNKYISVRAKGQKRYTRLNAKTLGEEYSKNNIIDYIENHNSTYHQGITKEEFENPIQSNPRLNKIIDVKNSTKAQSNVGYEKWAKLQNLKTLADTHSYLAENNLTFSDIKDMFSEKENAVTALENQKEAMQKHTERQKEIGELQNHLISYVKNRKVFEEYKKKGYSKIFKEENTESLEAYENARKYFDGYKSTHGIEKLPTMHELKDEYAKLKEIKSSYYDELKVQKEELKLLQTLKTNAMELLVVDENGIKTKTEKDIKRERDELIKIQKERLAQEKKYKNRNKNSR